MWFCLMTVARFVVSTLQSYFTGKAKSNLWTSVYKPFISR